MKALKNDNEAALKDYSLAIDIDSTYALAYYNRGVLKDNLNNIQDAINDFSKAIVIDPTYVKALLARADAYMQIGIKNKACEDYITAEKLGNTIATSKRILNCTN